MIIARSLFNTKDTESLFNIVSGDLERYYKYFSHFNVKREKFDWWIKQLIENTRNTYYGKTDYTDHIKNYLFQYMRDFIDTQDKERIWTVIELVNLHDGVKTKNEAVSVIEDFHRLTLNLPFGDVETIVNLLLSRTTLLDKALNYLCSKNRKIIASGNLESIGNCIIIPYIECFCNSNNIEVKKPELTKEFVNTQFGSAKSYLQAVEEIPIVTDEEERKMFESYLSGSDEQRSAAFIKIINSNKRLVAAIVKRYASEKYPFIDLNMVGLEILRTTISNYDGTDYHLFLKYLITQINFGIARYITREEEKNIPFIKEKIPRIVGTRKKTNKTRNDARTLCEILNCSKEQLEDLKTKISNEQLKKLQKRFGENLDTVLPMDDTQLCFEINPIIYLLKKLIKNPNYERNVKCKRPPKKLRELIICTDEQFNIIISQLREDELNALKAKYGENLDTVCTIRDRQLNEKIERTIRLLRKMLKTPGYKRRNKRIAKNSKTLCELLNCDYKTLLIIVKELTKKELDAIQERYGEDYKELNPIKSKEMKKDLDQALKNLKRILKNPEHKRRKRGQRGKAKKKRTAVRSGTKNLCEFLNCSKEQLISIIIQLTPDEIEKLQSRYGKNLDEVLLMDHAKVISDIRPLLSVLRIMMKNPDCKRKMINAGNKENYLAAMKEIGTIPYTKEFITSSSIIENKALAFKLFDIPSDENKQIEGDISQIIMDMDAIRKAVADGVVEKISNTDSIATRYKTSQDTIESSNYLTAMKEFGLIPFTRKLIVSSFEVKNRSLAFMLCGMTHKKDEFLSEPILPSQLAERKKVDIGELERMIDVVSKGVLKRVTQNQRIILGKSAVIPNKPMGAQLAIRPS